MPQYSFDIFHTLYAYFCIQGHITLFSDHLQYNPHNFAIAKHSHLFSKNKVRFYFSVTFMFSKKLVDKNISTSKKTANKDIFTVPVQ